MQPWWAEATFENLQTANYILISPHAQRLCIKWLKSYYYWYFLVLVELGVWTMFILNKAAFSMQCPLQNTPAATPFEYEEWKQWALSWSTIIYSHNWGLFQKKSAREAWTVMENSSQGTSLGTLKSLINAVYSVIRQQKRNICSRWGPVWVRVWHWFGLLH